MNLETSTWQEVDAYLAESSTIIVPIGSTEQHGPTGLLGTDSITARKIAEAIGDRNGALVGPSINVGMAQHHLGFAGTISLRPSTLLHYIVDYVNSLAVHGFDRFYFLNGHGGNIATLTAAFSELYAARSFAGSPVHGDPGANRPALNCVYQNWWAGSRVRRVSQQYFSGV